MKKIGMILAVVLLLSGCGKQAEVQCRVITGVQVEYQRQGEILERVYTRQESIGSVMNYLRMLKPGDRCSRKEMIPVSAESQCGIPTDRIKCLFSREMTACSRMAVCGRKSMCIRRSCCILCCCFCRRTYKKAAANRSGLQLQKRFIYQNIFLQPAQSERDFICSSWFLMLTVVHGAIDLVIKALEPMTESLPMTVSPPRTDAPA